MKKLLIAVLFLALMPVAASAAVCISGNTVTISSTAPGTDASGIGGYTFYRGTSDVFEDAAVIGTTDGNTPNFVESNVPDGTYYYFRTSRDTCGNVSDPCMSNQVTVDNTDPLPGEIHAG